jgi:hypothetical protein
MYDLLLHIERRPHQPNSKPAFCSGLINLCRVGSRKSATNSSIRSAGLNTTIALPGFSPVYAQTCGTFRGIRTETPVERVSFSYPTSMRNSPCIAKKH